MPGGIKITDDVIYVERGGSIVLTRGASLKAEPGAVISPYCYAGPWSGMPTAASSGGQMARVTDIGSAGFGSLWVSNGTRWLPMNGTAVLASMGAPVAGIDTTETILFQALIPAGAWQTNDTIRVFFQGEKSGGTDAGQMRLRVGTAGTTADTQVAQINHMGTTSVTHGGIYDVKLLSATSAQRIGAGTTTGYAGGTTGAATGAATITSAAANALYFTVSIFSGGATNTVSASAGQIVLVTP